tara:strand:+ start:32 stop:700 length:669 start_codon:yes stop_codon:yes gene_type:complete
MMSLQRTDFTRSSNPGFYVDNQHCCVGISMLYVLCSDPTGQLTSRVDLIFDICMGQFANPLPIPETKIDKASFIIKTLQDWHNNDSPQHRIPNDRIFSQDHQQLFNIKMVQIDSASFTKLQNIISDLPLKKEPGQFNIWDFVLLLNYIDSDSTSPLHSIGLKIILNHQQRYHLCFYPDFQDNRPICRVFTFGFEEKDLSIFRNVESSLIFQIVRPKLGSIKP